MIYKPHYRLFRLGIILSVWGAVLLLSSSCDKLKDAVKPKMPDATQEGLGTFGCYVNDKLWLPYTEHTLDSDLEGDYTPGEGIFRLRAEYEYKNREYIHFVITDKSGDLQPGTYPLGDAFMATYEVNASSGNDFFETKASDQGSVTITKVEAREETMQSNKILRYTIISGTFSFTATSAQTGRQVTVKDGRFDVKAF